MNIELKLHFLMCDIKVWLEKHQRSIAKVNAFFWVCVLFALFWAIIVLYA